MRVAVYHNLGRGGALRQLHETVGRLAACDDVTVFTPALGILQHAAPSVTRDTSARQAFVGHPRDRMARTLLRPLARLAALNGAELQATRLIDGGGYDVALVFPCQLTQAPLLLARLVTPALYYAPEPRRRSVESGYRPAGFSANPLRRAVDSALEAVIRPRDRRAFGAATEVACNSVHTAERLAQAYGRSATVCYPGVDGGAFSDDGQRLDAAPYALTVGRIDPTKGHDLAIAAVAQMPGHPLELRIVGEGGAQGYVQRLQAQADAAGVKVHFHRDLSDAELAVVYRSAQVTLALSHLEPFGLTPLESMACGTPVVALHEGGYRETVEDGTNGLLVQRSAGAVAQGIGAILEGSLRQRTAREIRQTVLPRWSWDTQVDCIHSLLRSLGRMAAVGG